MKVVREIMKTDLFKAYKRLPYVIYKNKYLIPQKPSSPKFRYFLVKHDIVAEFRSKFPELVTPKFLEKAANKQNEKQLMQLYKDKYRQLRLKYCEKALIYNQKYIEPFQRQPSNKAAFIFYRQNKESLTTKWKSQNLKFNFKVLLDEYSSLTQEQKKPYEDMTEEENKEKKMRFRQSQKMCLIPKKRAASGAHIYIRQHMNAQFTRQNFRIYKELPQQIKEPFSMLSKQQTAILKQQYQQFLHRFQITEVDLKEIKDVCKTVSKVVRQIKKNKKNLKQKGFSSVLAQKQIMPTSINYNIQSIPKLQKPSTNKVSPQIFSLKDIQRQKKVVTSKTITSPKNQEEDDEEEWQQDDEQSLLQVADIDPNKILKNVKQTMKQVQLDLKNKKID